jgi:hypothetical protein
VRCCMGDSRRPSDYHSGLRSVCGGKLNMRHATGDRRAHGVCNFLKSDYARKGGVKPVQKLNQKFGIYPLYDVIMHCTGFRGAKSTYLMIAGGSLISNVDLRAVIPTAFKALTSFSSFISAANWKRLIPISLYIAVFFTLATPSALR